MQSRGQSAPSLLDVGAALWKARAMLSGGKGGKRAGFMLGRWTVLPDRNAIDGPGGRRPLEPMGMRLLLLLARRAPETVTRDEMIDALWQGRVVTDDAVNKQVSKLRAALAYQAADQNLIETVPKVGVRLTVSPAPIPALLKPHAWLCRRSLPSLRSPSRRLFSWSCSRALQRFPRNR